MTDRTVTLSDGSVWRFDGFVQGNPECPAWSGQDLNGEWEAGWMAPGVHEGALTATDHRAIADVLDGGETCTCGAHLYKRCGGNCERDD